MKGKAPMPNIIFLYSILTSGLADMGLTSGSLLDIFIGTGDGRGSDGREHLCLPKVKPWSGDSLAPALEAELLVSQSISPGWTLIYKPISSCRTGRRGFILGSSESRIKTWKHWGKASHSSLIKNGHTNIYTTQFRGFYGRPSLSFIMCLLRCKAHSKY